MNSLIVQSPRDLHDAAWPARADSGRARVLFLTSQVLGFRTWAAQLEAATHSCDFIDAVHVHLHAPRLLKALGAWIPPTKGGFWHAWRHWILWDRYMATLLRRVPLRDFDAIHVTNQYNAAAFTRQPEDIRAKTIVCVDATSALECREFGYSIVDRAPLIAAERKLMARIAAASGMTRWACDSLAVDCGVDASRIALARLGMPNTGSSLTSHQRARHGKRLAIAFIGNHWSRKGGDRLLRWHQSRWTSQVDLHLFGDSPADSGSLPGVIRHGVVDRARLVGEMLPAMDLMVMPTREDSLGWVFLEAQSAGVPVIASRIAGIASDVVEHGSTGFLCNRDADAEFIEATERILHDPILRADMSRRCIERMRSEWDPARCAERYFREVLRLTAPGTVVA